MQAYGDGIDEFTLSAENKGPIQAVYERKKAEREAAWEANKEYREANMKLLKDHIKEKRKAKWEEKKKLLGEAEEKP